MRILWIAGLGAVLITGAASAQMTGQSQQNYGGQVPQAGQASPNDRSPDNILQRQDPRLDQGRLQTRQNFDQRGAMPEGLRRSDNDPSPDNIRDRQQGQSNAGGYRDSRSPSTNTGMNREPGVSTMFRENAPRDAASRAYMGGGLILENGRPVPLPGDPPGAASDFRAENVEQSTARAERSSPAAVVVMPGERRMDPADLVEPPRPNDPQTNVGQTGAPGQGASGSPYGAFPANPPTPGGRVPTGN